MRIPLASPDVTEQDRRTVLDVLNGHQLSVGPYTASFERKVADLTGNKHGIAVNSGTSGLHLLIRALGISEGHEVITTPFSFVASSNVILYERAVPHFVDIDEKCLDITPEAVLQAVNSRTRAVLPVDVFGQPASLMELRELAFQHGLKLIEDSCESLGAAHRGMPTGHPSLCDGAVFAFYPNKQITTGEGGVIVTSDDEVAGLCRSMRNQGRGEGGHWLLHERLGYNYRIDEMSAALGVSQLSRFDDILSKRDAVAQMYTERLAKVDGVSTPLVAEDTTRMSWFVYVIRFSPYVDRDRAMEWLSQHGIGCRPYFTPIHLQPFYRREFGYKEGDFPITERVAQSTLAIPFFNNLSAAMVEEVVYYISKAVELFGV
jgi:perosamine synthetase